MAERQNFAWLTLLRLLANQLIILAKQTAHTHTDRDHKFPLCVSVCIMHLSAPSICGASTSSCCSIDNQEGASNGKEGWAEHRNQDEHT